MTGNVHCAEVKGLLRDAGGANLDENFDVEETVPYFIMLLSPVRGYFEISLLSKS